MLKLFARFGLFISVVLLGSAGAGGSQARSAGRYVVAAWDDAKSGEGFLRAIEVAPPWNFASPPVAVGRGAVLRAAGGHIFAVSKEDGRIDVVDPGTWSVVQTYSLGTGSRPVDIAVVSTERAYVTREGATHLLRLELSNGAAQEVVDLGMFADADGVPDMAMMAMHGDRLFVALRRIDNESGGFALPAMVAVVDLATEQLVDADPVAPGVQAIALAGWAPKFKMQVVPAAGRLFVGATGDFFDEGGVEAVDLATLQSAGLMVAEAEGMSGADIGAFVLVEPGRGFLTFTTDLLLSSHLAEFTTAGVVSYPSYVTLNYFVPTMVADIPSGQFFLAHSDGVEHGVHVFETAGGGQLTANPIPLTGPPSDLVLLCDCMGPACGTELTCERVPAMGTRGVILFVLLAVLADGAVLGRMGRGGSRTKQFTSTTKTAGT